MNLYLKYGKRTLDIFLSCFAVILFLPMFILILLAYAVTFSFPVFYRQERIGKNRKSFMLVKFRSLERSVIVVGEEYQQRHHHQRRFWLGDILRFTSLDELPQIFQVLAGQMSWVGPRPLPIEYLSLFSEEQHQRHTVLPGITGWAQVNGRNSIGWSRKFELDNYYVKHVSPTLDLMILVMTVGLLFSFKKDVSLGEGKFTGN